METGPISEHIEPPARDSTHQLNQSTNKWWVLIAIGIGTFMSALDGSIVNTILPIVSKSFNTDIAKIEWVVTIYLLIVSGLLISFGRLGDIRGHKLVYTIGFFIFLVSSTSCALSPSVNWLILFRGIQALGGAMLAANSPAILTKSFPSAQRGQALGLQSTMTYLGLTVGPSVGGWISDYLGWRMVFYINVPVVIVAIVLSLRFIAPDRPEQVTERFDLPGAFLFMGGLICLLFGLNQGYALGWMSAPIIATLCSSVILLGVFLYVERHSKLPMLDLQLFSNRQFSASVASAILNYLCVFTILFITPFYLIQARGFAASRAGLILTAMPLVMALVAALSGTLSDRIGTRTPALLGMIVLALGLYALSRLGENSPVMQIAVSLGIAGFGTGTFISPNTSALMGAAPRHRQGIAAGIMATSRNLGMVLGIGLSGAILTTYMSQSSIGQPPAMFEAIHLAFLVAAGFSILGSIITSLRANA